MIYVTGDIHRDIDRFKKNKTINGLTANDYLIVCGDFGFVWDDSNKEKHMRKWIGKQKYTVLFVEGTHDNLDILATYETVDWNGGKARMITDNIIQLMRGHVFTIEGLKLFAFGGGESTDIADRTEGVTWWSNELPSIDEMIQARNNLRQHDYSFDYAITHECGEKIKNFLYMDNNRTNHLNAFFDAISDKSTYKCWFFAGYHLDKPILPKHRAIFKDVICINNFSVKSLWK